VCGIDPTTFDGGVFGGAGNDFVNGGPGDDYIDGGVGDDVCNGGRGNDTFAGCEVQNDPDA
jgi:Ca2+-binding RTX toxin-like protein